MRIFIEFYRIRNNWFYPNEITEKVCIFFFFFSYVVKNARSINWIQYNMRRLLAIGPSRVGVIDFMAPFSYLFVNRISYFTHNRIIFATWPNINRQFSQLRWLYEYMLLYLDEHCQRFIGLRVLQVSQYCVCVCVLMFSFMVWFLLQWCFLITINKF